MLCVLNCGRLFETTWTVVHHALLSIGFFQARKNAGVGCHFLLQGIFPTQRLNSHFLHYGQTLYHRVTWEAKCNVSCGFFVCVLVHVLLSFSVFLMLNFVENAYSTSTEQFSCYLVMSDSLQPHGLQHARPPCPSPTPRVYSNSCPLS